MPRRVLAIDDDPGSLRLVRAILASEGFDVAHAATGKAGLDAAKRAPPDLVVLDLHLPDLDGIELLEKFGELDASLPVVMLTAHADLKTAVRATRLGAFDYLTKPVEPDELLLAVRRALETRDLRHEVADLKLRLGEDAGLGTQMGPSAQVKTIIEQVQTVAATDFSVLILGETGTGKELVAQAIHRQSKRRSKSFIAVDCGAIPETLLESELFGHERGAFTGAERRKEGRFRLAEGGTVFLDEVGNLPLALQSKLLRVLESRQLQAVGSARSVPMDVRFLAATNDDLQQRATAGKFRPDLYFRLAQYSIGLPPLRARPGDIAFLARRFLEEVSVELRRPVADIAPEALSLLERHPWPGNVRELRNVVRQAVLESRDVLLRRAHVDKLLGSAGSPSTRTLRAGRTSLREAADAAAREAERQLICEVLHETRGNKSQAARILRTDYKTLHLKLKALGIRALDYAP